MWWNTVISNFSIWWNTVISWFGGTQSFLNAVEHSQKHTHSQLGGTQSFPMSQFGNNLIRSILYVLQVVSSWSFQMVLKTGPHGSRFYSCLLPRCIHCRLVQCLHYILHGVYITLNMRVTLMAMSFGRSKGLPATETTGFNVCPWYSGGCWWCCPSITPGFGIVNVVQIWRCQSKITGTPRREIPHLQRKPQGLVFVLDTPEGVGDAAQASILDHSRIGNC